ncbi:MAG: hypothetical protein Q4F24_08075 [Eubacteriales bacterium]|nr:hypothetical protein [Eubacteriales bacterium]
MGRKEALERQQEIVSTAAKEKRGLTDEESREFSNLQVIIDAEPQNRSDGERGAGDAGQEGEESDNTREAERQRVKDIMDICRGMGIDMERTQEYITGDMTVDGVRKAIMDGMIRDKAPVPASPSVIRSEEDKFRAAATDALLLRGGIELKEPADGAMDLRGMSLRDMVIRSANDYSLLQKSNSDLYEVAVRQFMNPSAAFPAIMDNAIEKAYKEGYKSVEATFERWTKRGELKDFKTHDNYYLSGPAGEFLEVPEGGELKHDTMTDEKLPTRKLKTYGRQFTMTRQAFINDDVGFIVKMPAKYAKSQKKTINKQVYDVLFNNSAIYDGKKLFCADHKNILAVGSKPTLQSLTKMMMALQLQKNQFDEAIYIRPAVIVTPIGYGQDFFTILNSENIETEGNTKAKNPLYKYRSNLEIVEEPVLNALAKGGKLPWFMVGDKDDVDGVQVDYLNGKSEPNIRRSEVAGQLGVVWDIFSDWGITVMDYRGMVRNDGVAIDFSL